MNEMTKPANERNDIELKILVSESLFLALKRSAENDDRALSAYCRRALASHELRLSGVERRVCRPEPGQDMAGYGQDMAQ